MSNLLLQKSHHEKLHRSNRVAWIMPCLLLLAILLTGGFALLGAHASPATSSLNGRYNFRGATLAGPLAGLYLTGSLAIKVDTGTGSIAGNICGFKIAPNTCTSVSGSTPDEIHVNLTFQHVNRYPNIVLTGLYQASAGNRGGFDGFVGTYTMGASSGKWEAAVGTILEVSGSWNLYGIVHSGPNNLQQFHGVLTLLESSSNHRITGTYCPGGGGSCVVVTGGRDLYGNFFFYVDVSALNHLLRLRGTFVSGSASRISGIFYSLGTTPPTTDRGYWIGHSAV
jgi:hypothetical protein